ncbi:MAG: pyridoxal-phosphate dependent enzyme, partial [Christensenellaceae bacterium]|nr:pyridoxal-phosphate dependent enzyme [Christensenellaceae bacterium]
MMNIIENFTDLIGNTPLYHAKKLEQELNLNFKLLLKLEMFNPAGSVKDRAALFMTNKAVEEGLIKEGATIIEPTSGNTGIGLASIAVPMGYKVVLVMPETMSQERRSLLSAYGAELVLTPGDKGMSGAIAKAEELLNQTPNSFMPSQFTNVANTEAHYNTTGPEIWQQTEGNIDYFVAGVGTGGTITGTGQYLKAKNPNIKVIAVEPENSAVLSGKASGQHQLQGIGAGFIPQVLDTNIYNDVVTVGD